MSTAARAPGTPITGEEPLPALVVYATRVDYRVFAGVIDRHQWPLGSRLFYHALGGRLGDNRNWKAIDSWAACIARTLADAQHPAARMNATKEQQDDHTA
jgi:hypothetical protein